ncbi:MFS transporter [Pontibacillus salicampi]|uniref:MFS transporter n=1 Tax=Pontibacillus salicampi TaxID=1449801 RepID=A0ABV6LKT6_9BACI
MKKNTLASHNIRLLFWAEICGSVRFIQPVLTLFYFARGLESSDILIIMTFFSLGVLIGELPTGAFADRFGSKSAFLIGSGLGIVSHSLLFIAYEPWVFFLSSGLTGVAATFFSGADEALIYESLKLSKEEDSMDQAIGNIASASFLVTIFIVIIGAILARDLTNQQFTTLIGLGIAFLCIEFILLLFIKNPPSQGTYQGTPMKQIVDGCIAIKQHPAVLWMFLNITLVFIPATAIFEKFDQKVLVDAGLPVYWIGGVYACASIAGFIASRFIASLTRRTNRVLLLRGTGFLAVVCLCGVAIWTHTLWVILVMLILLKLVSAIRYPVYAQLANDIIPSNVRATTISLLSIVDSCLDLVIFTTISGIATKGMTALFFSCAFIALIGVLLPVKPKQPIEEITPQYPVTK